MCVYTYVCIIYVSSKNIPFINIYINVCILYTYLCGLYMCYAERWGAGVETQKNVRGEVGGWGRVPFNEPYAPSLSTIYDGA